MKIGEVFYWKNGVGHFVIVEYESDEVIHIIDYDKQGRTWRYDCPKDHILKYGKSSLNTSCVWKALND